MIFLEKKHYEIVKNILEKYPYTFYIFGSRVRGDQKKFSDIDFGYFDTIPDPIKSHIFEDFENSDLPFTIDLVNLKTCSSEFMESIKKDLIVFA